MGGYTTCNIHHLDIMNYATPLAIWGVISPFPPTDIMIHITGVCTSPAVCWVISPSAPPGYYELCYILCNMRSNTTLSTHGYYEPYHKGVDTPHDVGSNITLSPLPEYYRSYHSGVDIPCDVGSIITLSQSRILQTISQGDGHLPQWGVISLSPTPDIMNHITGGWTRPPPWCRE